ncbi:MAG: 4Fe-4S cluster-binding domain-containing protein, partial [Candidatus Thalassarchaeaceae archaeon]|nr:4Fe-4S cluster-binding domain-containing protein [Candidatus Thalassarchaeaceae archaeon]
MMANEIPEGELPSCNLWIRSCFKAVYPEVESGEDHWLVAHLLLNQSNEGAILSGQLHAKYTLTGRITQKNREEGKYRNSRKNLNRSAHYWISKRLNSADKICLGWGGEGVVWHQNGQATKRFHSLILSNEHVAWLQTLRDCPMPIAKWSFNNDRWEATYDFKETEPALKADLPMVSQFIEKCLEKGIVFINITRSNFRIKDEELYHVDIGNYVVPFEVRYFRDMCAQLYLVFIRGIDDDKIRNVIHSFRNNVDAMKSIDGFEQFYHREIHKYVYCQGSFLKPNRSIQPVKRLHGDVTLMVKTCAMEASLIERQANHIVNQICRYDEFSERILLIDPKEGKFLRQYTEGNLKKLLETADILKQKGVFDRVLISPFSEHDLVEQLYSRWFDVRCSETHNVEGAPVFPQLWGFEQVSTRYLLQMDADVIIGREKDDNIIARMLEALVEDNVFGVGFNIPQPLRTEFTAYSGKFVPEVRCGLFDIERILSKRPFPNQIKQGHLTTSWHRAIEQFQNNSEWRCLRGGGPYSWYIHPPNLLKHNLQYYERVIDLAEQGMIPDVQRSKWDLIDIKEEWNYPSRNEELIFTTVISDFTPHWTRALLRSLMIQNNNSWGAVIFDNCSSPQNQRRLTSIVNEFGEHFTLVKSRFVPIDTIFIKDMLSEICTHTNPMIINLTEKEIMFNTTIVRQINDQLISDQSYIISPTYLARQPLGLSEDTTQLRSNQFNVTSSIRGVRLSLFDGDCNDVLYRQVGDAAKSLKLSTFSVYNADMTIDADGSEVMRPSTYVPNMNKIEIDITYLCNLTCAGCSRSSAQAPSGQHMPMEMIQNFLKESETKGLKWESLHILGGEPTLHPNFVEIVTLLDNWFMAHSPDTELKVISNGVSRKVQNNIKKIPERWRYENSFKHDHERDTSHFVPFNLAPIDLPKWRNEDFTKGCYIT